MNKKGYHHGDLRRVLIEEAIDTIESRGPGSINLRELSTAAGVSRAAPYRHFRNREHLLTAVAAEGFRRLREKCRGVTPSSAEIRLEELGKKYLDFSLSNPGLYSLMFDPARFEPPENLELRRASDEAFETVASVLKECSGNASPELNAGAVWAMVHGLATLINRHMTGMINIEDTLQCENGASPHGRVIRHAMKVLSTGISVLGKAGESPDC